LVVERTGLRATRAKLEPQADTRQRAGEVHGTVNHEGGVQLLAPSTLPGNPSPAL
jgi:hypothetical protein